MANRWCAMCNGAGRFAWHPPMAKGFDCSCPSCGGSGYVDDPTYTNTISARFVPTKDLRPGDQICVESYAGVLLLRHVQTRSDGYVAIDGIEVRNLANVETEFKTTIPGGDHMVLLISRTEEVGR